MIPYLFTLTRLHLLPLDESSMRSRYAEAAITRGTQGIMKRLLLLIVSTSIYASALSGESNKDVTGMYSNLEYNAEAGGILGIEVYLVYGGSGYFALVQCAGGDPAPPVVVPVDVAGAKISFKLPEDQPKCGTFFSGTISQEGLRGRFAGENDDQWLPRRGGYWAW